MKIVLLVIDGFGIGNAHDAEKYGDLGADTYHNIVKVSGIVPQNLIDLGLNNIDGVNFNSVDNPSASYGRMVELSAGKDTTTGHFELAGVVLERPFPTYPDGFPSEIIAEFEEKIALKTLFNGVASGTEIIERLGGEHYRTGYPIVYTSADSVFQIAMSEDIIPLKRQYEISQIAREILTGDHGVARVITRPFKKIDGKYVRTENRRDFAIAPQSDTVLDRLKAMGFTTYAIGKIEDIFANRGITKSNHTHTNGEGLAATVAALDEPFSGLIFVNLVDTDMLYGHRRDAQGYSRAIMEIDSYVPAILNAMGEGDKLIITSDHGCDPTFSGTDHTRENVPLLIYGEIPKNLGTIEGFNFVSKYILDCFNKK